MTLLSRIAANFLSIRCIRTAGGKFFVATGVISSRVGVDPVVEVPLHLFGIDAKFAIHIFKRDMTALVQIFGGHVYDQFCPLLPGDTVIDCEAYIGEFTIYAATKVGDKGLVLAFEPNPDSFALLKYNVARNNLGNVKLINTALGKEEDHVNIRVDKANPGASRIVKRTSSNDSFSVTLRRLTNFASLLSGRTVKLLKMDVEGAAMEIIEGASDIIANKLIENVVVEIHHGEEGLWDLLAQRGFRCRRVGNYLYASLST